MSVAEEVPRAAPRSWRGTENRRRTKSVGVRLDPAEYRDLLWAADRAGKTIPALLRDTALREARNG